MPKQKKGDWLIGGRVDLNTGENSTQIGFNPGAGYFFAKNFAAGGNFAINYVKSGDLKTTSFGLGPFARYYFTTWVCTTKKIIWTMIPAVPSPINETLFQTFLSTI